MVGPRIGRYEVGRLLGRGGQGEVFEAVLHGPAGLRRAVALKILAGGSDALRREARLGGLLRHPNLVDVYEVGEADGTWFCAMELCRGGSLEEHRPLPPRAAVEATIQVCRALAYAHGELGLVHLDLKPANLLVDGATIKVADLGIARAAGFDWDGRLSGTPRYLSPELARGDPVDARSDLYALGLVLADLLTPAGSEVSATFSLDAGEVAAPEVEAPEALQAIVLRCTAPAPDDRFPDAAALGLALAELALDGPGLADVFPPVEAPVVEAEPVFVGRTAELAALRAALEIHPVVTLKGPGGIGKTRLARELLADAPGARVSLAEVTGRAGALQAVAAALEVPLGPDPVAQLGHALAARGRFCLVLDTVEHLGAEVRELVESWSARAPQARLLCTSIAVAGLGVVVDLGPLRALDAVALLRARLIERGVEPGDDPALPALADRLDGHPLALELAAGRVGVWSAAEVLERMEVSWLRSAGAGRSATLEATLDWSWGLLEPDHRRALAQLSVFRGGFSADVAEEVVQGAGLVLDALAALLDASWLSVEHGRFRLLSPVRDFAAGRLDDADAVRERHGRAFAARIPRSLLSLRIPADDLANLEAGARWAAAAGDAGLALSLARGVVVAYRRRGPPEGGAPVVEVVRAVARDPVASWTVDWLACRSTSDLRRSLAAAGLLVERADALGERERSVAALLLVADRALHCGDLPQARDASVRALADALALADDETIALARVTFGLVALRQGEVADARGALEAARAWCEQVGPYADATLTLCLNNLGLVARDRGRAEASAHFRAAIEVARRIRDRRSEGIALGNLAMRALEDGDPAGALALAEEAAAVHREAGNRMYLPQCLDLIGTALGQLDRTEEARRVLDEALAVATELGVRLWVGTVRGTLALLERERGELTAAVDHAERAVEVLDAAGERLWTAQARASLAELELSRGRPEVALGLLDAAREVLSERRVVRGEILLHRARALAALGRGDEARTEAGRSLQAATEDGRPATAAQAEALRRSLPPPAGEPPDPPTAVSTPAPAGADRGPRPRR